MAYAIIIFVLILLVVVAVVTLMFWTEHQKTLQLSKRIQQVLLDRGLQGEVVDRHDRVSPVTRSGLVKLVLRLQDGRQVHCEFLVVDNEPSWVDDRPWGSTIQKA